MSDILTYPGLGTEFKPLFYLVSGIGYLRADNTLKERESAREGERERDTGRYKVEQ